MCGITGVIDFKNKINQNEFDYFTDSLRHRGPDGRGVYIENNIALGHRRLAILDLSDNGACPMSAGGQDGQRYHITYNGEIYNFIEIRTELQSKGYVFNSDCDTEVVLKAFIEWGEECQFKFNGMWAFAIWDSLKRELFLSRDRFGIKPLYYYHDDNFFAFASELKAFKALKSFDAKLDREHLKKIIFSPGKSEGVYESTLLSGVSKLHGGHSAVITCEGGLVTKKWWETIEHLTNSVPRSYKMKVKKFRELLEDSVCLRMRSDVDVGTSLSGGVDSSCIASLMGHVHHKKPQNLQRSNTDWHKAFIATFPGSELNEKKYADIVVEHTGVVPHYTDFSLEDCQSKIYNSIWVSEDIFGLNAPILSNYKAMRSNNIYVTLDGHGADELLAGYGWYLDFKTSDLNKVLYYDFHRQLFPSILRNYDRCSMAHGVEVRMPFLDWRLVSYIYSLDLNSKLGAGFTKRILRDSMAGIAPQKILERRGKIGFNSPLIDIFNDNFIVKYKEVFNHPLWEDDILWSGGKDSRKDVVKRMQNCDWVFDDWATCFRVWTRINAVMWDILFVENDWTKLND